MRAVDTNLLLRLLVRDDPRQTAAAAAFIEPGAWVSHIVLMEATWVLSSVYQRGPSHIADAVALLLEHEHLVVQDADAVTAALAWFRGKPSVGFSDSLILEVARKAGHLPLGTFDRDLAHLDGAQKV